MIFTVVLTLLVLISLVGNTLVILTVLINKPMHTTLNYLLVNLAVADMISALCMGVGYIITSFIAYPEGEIGRYLCMFVIGGDLAWIGAAESILCLVYIAVERYFAILLPLRQRGRFTRRRLRVFIILGWSFAIVLRVPTSLEVRYYHSELRMCKSDDNVGHIIAKAHSLAWMVLAGIVPLSIMVCLYSRIVHHLWFKPVHNFEASQRASLRYRKQVTITLITVSIIYAVCWIPILAGYLVDSWSEVMPWFDKTVNLLLTLNSSVNPVLYSIRMKQFRKHLCDMLLCKNRQRRRGQSAEKCVGPTLRQQINASEECARNPAAATSLSLSPTFKLEVFTVRESLDNTNYRRNSSIIARATVDNGDLETCTTEQSQKQKK